MNKNIQKLAGIYTTGNLLRANNGDYIKVRGETALVIQRTSSILGDGTTDWSVRKASGTTNLLTAKDADEVTCPTPEEALMLRTIFVLSRSIIPVSKRAGC